MNICLFEFKNWDAQNDIPEYTMKHSAISSFFIFSLFFCAASVSAIGPYTDNGDTVTDQGSGLTWQKQTADTNNDTSINSSDTVSWQEALTWCEGSTMAGEPDWRLPNIRELKSLIDWTTYNPIIDSVFQCELSYYWSTTTSAPSANSARGVSFDYGYDGNYPKTTDRYVRCVRGGLPGSFNLSIILAGSGSGTVNLTPPNRDCSVNCTESYAVGAVVTLTATPASGSAFSGWSGGGCSGSGTCIVTMNQARMVTASFSPWTPGKMFSWPMFLPAIIGSP